MHSYFGRQSTNSSLTLDEFVDLLQRQELDLEQVRAHIISFARDGRSRHHNTYLLLALAWNKLRAANRLLNLDTEHVAINLADEWPTCQNTPLILAAKINADTILKQLIDGGADLDRQDYRGYTALHYACLYRNDAAITMLLDAGASVYLRDAFDKLPQDYYAMMITPDDLIYRYGENGGELRCVSDNNNHYFASKNKSLSALRWYIAHWIENAACGDDIVVKGYTLLKWAQKSLKVRLPIDDAIVYEAMMRLFCERRPRIDEIVLSRLQDACSKLNPYIEATFNKYYLSPLDLVPPANISVINNQIWVELPERQAAASLSSPETPVPSSSCYP